MPHYPQFADAGPLDSCKDDPDALTVVNNNDHPVKLPFGGTLGSGQWFRFPMSKLFRSHERP